MVKKDISKNCNFFISIECIKVDSCSCECIIAWCEDGVFGVTAKCCNEVCCAESSDECGVDGCCLSCHSDVHCRCPHVCATFCCADVRNLVRNHVVTSGDGLTAHCVVLNKHVRIADQVGCSWNNGVRDDVVTDVTWWWHENLVNDVNNPIAGFNVCCGDGCSTDHDAAVANGEGCFVSVGHNDGESVGDLRRVDISSENVVQQNVCKSFVFFWCVKCREINARISKGLICWCKDRERSITLQRCYKTSMGECGHERIVDTCCCCIGWDIFCCISSD